MCTINLKCKISEDQYLQGVSWHQDFCTYNLESHPHSREDPTIQPDAMQESSRGSWEAHYGAKWQIHNFIITATSSLGTQFEAWAMPPVSHCPSEWGLGCNSQAKGRIWWGGGHRHRDLRQQGSFSEPWFPDVSNQNGNVLLRMNFSQCYMPCVTNTSCLWFPTTLHWYLFLFINSSCLSKKKIIIK